MGLRGSPVVGPPDAQGKYPIIGTVYHIDALRTLNRALVETAAEEHG